MDVEEARRRLRALQSRLAENTKRDPEQEVSGIAIPVIDAVLNASRDLIPDNDVIRGVLRDLIDPDAIAQGIFEPVRCVDMLHVVDQLLQSLPAEPIPEVYFGNAGSPLFDPHMDF